MKVIDCHTHPLFNDDTFAAQARENGIKFGFNQFLEQLDKNDVDTAIAIGNNLASNRFLEELSEKSDRILPVAGILIEKLGAYVRFADDRLKARKFRGLKIYLGYDHIAADSMRLEPIYKLAERYRVPVIFHTGDTWKKMTATAELRYAYPLAIDTVASRHPELKILIAHSGNPWTEEAAAIIYKNDNCYADISGWFIGSIDKWYGNLMRDKLRYMIAYAGEDKIMFGTDWPLIRMDLYIDFLRNSVAPSLFRKIAYNNAKRFWGL